MAKLTRRSLIAGGVLAAGGATAGVLAAVLGDDEASADGEILARRVSSPVPGSEPDSGAWDDAESTLVPVEPQRVVAPFAEVRGVVSRLRVEALHDGSELALRLSWPDDEGDDLNGIGRFGDAIAVQLPARVGETPPVTMGGPGAPVHVLQWRASWQRDLDGHVGTKTLYPNLVRDVQPAEVLPAEVAALWSPGLAVGNPISAVTRESAVEELVAEGFGSLTGLAQQRARGAGVWADGEWRVAIGLPLDRMPAADPLEPGSVWPVAFARWAGSRGHRGARKDFANWVNLRLAR